MITPLLRRLVLLAVLGGVASAPALGQADPKSFVADSAAEAVMLCDFGRSHFEVK